MSEPDELRGTHIRDRGKDYSDTALLQGGPHSGRTAKVSPEHDHLYIQDSDAVWVYVKRAEPTGDRTTWYEFDHQEALP